MNYLSLALDHHRDACLDNHDEEGCFAIILAKKIGELQQLIERGSMSAWMAGHVYGNSQPVICTNHVYDILPWEITDYLDEH